MKWRGQGILRIALTQIGTHECGDLRLDKVWVRFRSCFETLTGKREIDHRR